MKPSKVRAPARPATAEAPLSYERLALSAIEQPGTHVVSFDFFDTLVKRQAVRPTDIFMRVGERLLHDCTLSGFVSARRFAQQREAAERSARQKATGGTEVTLEQIYTEMAFLFDDPAQCADAARAELAVERENIFANPVADGLLARALKLGRICVVCSDTYFSAQQLRILHKLPPKVRVFASSEHRTGKTDGLFDIMLQTVGRSAHEAVHFGDNYHADVEAAQRRGMRAMLLPNGTSTSWDIVAGERKLMADPACAPAQLHRRERTHGTMTSLRHAALLRGETAEELGYRGFGATVFGPAVLGYLRWVREQTRRHDSPLIVGLAREGLPLIELYDALVGERPTAPLCVSRAVLAGADLADWHRDRFEALVPTRQGVPLEMFASRLGLLRRDFPATLRGVLVSAHDPLLAAELFEHIDTRPALRERARSHGLRLRERLACHLRRVLGDLDDPALRDVAVLDIGWGGSIQARLARMFDLPRHTLLGLYFAVNDAALDRAAGGARIGGYLFDGRESYPLAERSLRSVEVFEQAFTPARGSVIDYTQQGEPILAADTISPLQREQAAQIRAGVRDFCELAMADELLLGDDEEWRHAARVAVARFCLSPHENGRTLFAGWMHDDNSAGGALDPICPAVFDCMSTYLTPRQLLDEGFGHTYWPAALSAPEAVRLRTQALAALRSAEPPDLVATGSGVLLRCRLGHGGPPDGADATEGFSGFQEAALNLYHRSAVTWCCPASAGPFLDLEFAAQHPALVALDGLVLRRRARGGGAQDTMLIEGAQLRESVAPGSAASLLAAEGGPTLLLAPGISPRLVVANPLQGEGESPVDVTVLLRVWTDLPEGLAGGVDMAAADPVKEAPAGLEGCLDTLFGHAVGRDGDHLCAVLAPGETYAVHGWLLDTNDGLAPSEGWFLLEQEGEHRRFVADRRARPDLGAHFGRIIAGRPGLHCRVGLAGLRTGQYPARLGGSVRDGHPHLVRSTGAPRRD